ncbi:GNAT family N-acetyltransferase [Flagellimonas sp. CMM7]|uniref:GNAT family N-acetyltransferase n=1 Tax=Flagellimonas sp. CMM7 TaxID=2654676 RepID=UPI0013D613AB|nr:GNAT family N-acetyltransferase [Flagellimonas sp. CMM7]UII81062.1 GNAT family N-acetyltransferase [Flagellimonas sp. CMM7]
MIEYQIENDLSLEEFKSVLTNSSLAERRPVNKPDRLQKMLQYGNLIVTARIGGKIIGVSRSLTDYTFCTYLSDLAVDKKHQRQGIGIELIRQTKLKAPDALLILLSAPSAISYYPKIGMNQHMYCYYLDNIENLK